MCATWLGEIYELYIVIFDCGVQCRKHRQRREDFDWSDFVPGWFRDGWSVGALVLVANTIQRERFQHARRRFARCIGSKSGEPLYVHQCRSTRGTMHQTAHLEDATAFANAATIECEPAARPTRAHGGGTAALPRACPL